MSIARRLSRLELNAASTERVATHRVIVYTSSRRGERRRFTKDDREVALEIIKERERRCGPRETPRSEITPDDLLGWRDGRRAEAVHGIGHRDYGGSSQDRK